MLVLSWGGSYWLDISVSIKTNFFLEEYQISKQTLNTLYCTYIRPLLEYASDVWDGCSQTDENSHSFTGICFIKFVILWNWVGNHGEELIRSYLLCIRSSITKLRNTLLIFRPTESGTKHITTWGIIKTSKFHILDCVLTKIHFSFNSTTMEWFRSCNAKLILVIGI